MPRLDRGVWGKGVLMRSFFKAISIVAAVQLFTAVSAFGFHLDPSLDLEPPFVICEDQQYALCAAENRQTLTWECWMGLRPTPRGLKMGYAEKARRASRLLPSTECAFS